MKGLIEVENQNDFEKSQGKEDKILCDTNEKNLNQWGSDVWEPYEWPTIQWNPEYKQIECIKEDTSYGSDVGSPSSTSSTSTSTSTSSSITSLNPNDKESGFNSIDDDESWNVELFDPNRPYANEPLAYPDNFEITFPSSKHRKFKPHHQIFKPPKVNRHRRKYSSVKGQFDDY